MIDRADILSIEYLKMAEYTGGYRGMRYRMEKIKEGDGERLRAVIWPEPFNFVTTPEDQKRAETFSFDEDGITDAVAWMNDRYFEDKKVWEEAYRNWDTYVMK